MHIKTRQAKFDAELNDIKDKNLEVLTELEQRIQQLARLQQAKTVFFMNFAKLRDQFHQNPVNAAMLENQKATEAAIQETRINGMGEINKLQQEVIALKEKNKLLTQETQQYYELQEQALLDKRNAFERRQETV